jgi:hypothetical protein
LNLQVMTLILFVSLSLSALVFDFFSVAMRIERVVLPEFLEYDTSIKSASSADKFSLGMLEDDCEWPFAFVFRGVPGMVLWFLRVLVCFR